MVKTEDVLSVLKYVVEEMSEAAEPGYVRSVLENAGIDEENAADYGLAYVFEN